MKISSNLSYKKEPIRILARDVRRLRNKEIPMIKVLWSNQIEEKATWEFENEMKSFIQISLFNFKDEILQRWREL
ncbi:hypothetical protein AXF42_Ash019889 [Apostasia shenzhenica]|uniref:Chromo domain-containing protein n=1 Tax=Apostasia shenzhenica TaxID=1088818 RepID=A0A2H9ZX43_9ASPA|nr:hypothetical protein AXF42_Ash019889 [Apostasia shenzhenica]